MKARAESFLLFVPLTTQSATVCLDIYIRRTHERIGLIAWCPAWRQFAFTPRQGGAYTRRTLQLIARKMGRLTKRWLDQKQAADPTFTPTRGAPKSKPRIYIRPGRPALEPTLL